MNLNKKSIISAFAALSGGALLYALVAIPAAEAQSGTRSRGGSYRGQQYGGSSTRQGGSATRNVQQSFESKFWNWMQHVEYKNWAPAPGQNGDYYEGQSPHGAYLKMYLNRTAVANSKNPPVGSVIIKENYGEDERTLMAVTVMYRSKGYDAAHNDWYWVKYNPDGTVAMKGDMRLAGRVQGCIKCHSDADGGDYLFIND